MPGETKSEGYKIVFIQDEEKKGEADSHMLQVLKEIQKKLDEWLKEKVDAKIESYEINKPGGKERKGIFRETHREVLPIVKIG